MDAMVERLTLPSGSASLACWWVVVCLLIIVLFLVRGDGNLSQLKFAENRLSAATVEQTFPLRAGLAPNEHVTADVENASLPQIIVIYGELTGRVAGRANLKETLNDVSGGYLGKWRVISVPRPPSLISIHHDGRWRADELKETLETILRTNRVAIISEGSTRFRTERRDPAPLK